MRSSSKFLRHLSVGDRQYAYYPVNQIQGTENLPYSLTVLLENVLRNSPNDETALELAHRIVEAGRRGEVGEEVEFMPARVLFQDFTGVPVFVDFAVMREACANLGGDPAKINPQIPCDLVIDHSVIADSAGCAAAMKQNMAMEFIRNKERYKFLKWAQSSFENVRIVPPGAGICHQLNVESFAQVVATAKPASQDLPLAYFDTLVGTDSHTPTANGIGVLGWGVGGIEAEAAALGQPITTLVPKVVGVRVHGKLSEGVAAMDVSLRFAELLREKGVVGCFVECFGEGLNYLNATQRACISNMTPEYGSTCTLFPVDSQTLQYLRLTNRDEDQIKLVEAYAKDQGFWNDGRERNYAEIIDLDLGEVERSMAGPSRPHDRISLAESRMRVEEIASMRKLDKSKQVHLSIDGQDFELGHGAIAIAAVTSCTTATDPRMMLACGLVAKKAHALGMKPKPWVKCIMAPGSYATELLLERAGLSSALDAIGFYTCGFGCMSCIGNSGPLCQEMHDIAGEVELASVLSGNRNFEGRISPDVSQNYLMTPAMVLAYALAGTVDIDIMHEALGTDKDGRPVYLADIWPEDKEVSALMESCVDSSLYSEGLAGLFDGDEDWKSLDASSSDLFAWDEDSTYVRRAPYFDGIEKEVCVPAPIEQARVLALLGDFITTDHISPAGSIAPESPAANYLKGHGVEPEYFNTYGSRRGNHEVMMRGTFGNVKLTNMLADGKKGGWTYDFKEGSIRPIFDAAMDYADAEIPLVVVAGKMYGSGSSRDWAAKGPMLLGVRAVFAQSFERIHRSNLIGMGILPLQFKEGESAQTLGLDGSEVYSIGKVDLSFETEGPQMVDVIATKPSGSQVTFTVQVRIDTPTEGAYYQNGGILQYVLRNLL
jgi:aconitate hydratase